MNTNYLPESRLLDQHYIADLFDRSHSDAIEVFDARGLRKGLVYLEDFCNSKDLKVERLVDKAAVRKRCDEENLLVRVLKLSPSLMEFARNAIFRKLGDKIVCCCDNKKIAQKICENVLGASRVNIRYTESVFELGDGDRVLFLSFNRIKLYRRSFRGKIETMLALNNVILDCENRSVFYAKYIDLMDAFTSIGVISLYGIIPEADKLTCMSEAAYQRVCGYGKIDYEFYANILGGSDSPDYIACMEQNKLSRVIDRGIFKSLQDCRGEFYNVTGGMRMTIGQPMTYSHTVYLFGPCAARGAMVADCNTVASLMQRKFNENGGDWLVLNCGVGGGSDLENSYRYALSLPLKAGDAIVFLESGSFLDEKTINGKTVFNLSDEFNEHPPREDWFLDRPAHCNTTANQIIAESFFNKIKEYASLPGRGLNARALDRYRSGSRVFSNSPELLQYVSDISKARFSIKDGECAGAILMHCNPMTRGHKYLITKALEEVDYLYVFLLSIDRSEIPYALRKDMLVYETRGMKNVHVMDCGEFMGSPKVFPDYFTKDSETHSRIDATKEVLVFCQYVAPALGITKRFVGTENRDFVTRQYNNQLKLILPMYGLQLREIERMTEDGCDVSAFSTRQLIHAGDWVGARKHVSEHTFKLLARHYGKEGLNA